LAAFNAVAVDVDEPLVYATERLCDPADVERKMKLRTKWMPALVGFAALSVAGCYQKSSLESSRVEVVKVEGRRFEVRVTPTETPDEYRMLIIRATMVVNPDPELEMGRAQEVAERYMKQTCKGRAYKEIVSGLEGGINYRIIFQCV
jgi:hypothetical protein